MNSKTNLKTNSKTSSKTNLKPVADRTIELANLYREMEEVQRAEKVARKKVREAMEASWKRKGKMPHSMTLDEINAWKRLRKIESIKQRLDTMHSAYLKAMKAQQERNRAKIQRQSNQKNLDEARRAYEKQQAIENARLLNELQRLENETTVRTLVQKAVDGAIQRERESQVMYQPTKGYQSKRRDHMKSSNQQLSNENAFAVLQQLEKRRRFVPNGTSLSSLNLAGSGTSKPLKRSNSKVQVRVQGSVPLNLQALDAKKKTKNTMRRFLQASASNGPRNARTLDALDLVGTSPGLLKDMRRAIVDPKTQQKGFFEDIKDVWGAMTDQSKVDSKILGQWVRNDPRILRRYGFDTPRYATRKKRADIYLGKYASNPQKVAEIRKAFRIANAIYPSSLKNVISRKLSPFK